MSDDPSNDKAFDDLSKWPIESLPNTDSGAIEIRRRALETFFEFMRARYGDESQDVLLETMEVTVADAHDGVFGPEYVPTAGHDCSVSLDQRSSSEAVMQRWLDSMAPLPAGLARAIR